MKGDRPSPELVEAVTAAVVKRGGKLEGDEYRFQCVQPDRHAHADANPSARWNPGKAVWRCDVCGEGGGAVDLARRLGVDPASTDRPFARETVWPLRDSAGTVVAEHVRVDRRDGKQMWWRRPDGRRGLGGLRTSDLQLYGVDRLAATDPAALVVVAEGERATDALLARGIVAVGTVTGASGTPSDEVVRVLAGRDVVLWPDADDPGRAHMRRVGARLSALGMAPRWYDPAPDATDGRDAADWTASDDGLRAAVVAAPAWEPGEVAARDDMVGILLADVEPEAVDWLWHGRLARGKLSILEGRPDEGKTTLALDLAARVSAGAPMPGETTRRPPAGVVIVTAEDGLADTIRPRLAAAAADLARCLGARPDESPSLDADGLAWLRRACARVGAKLVILDPLVALMPGAVDAHRDQDVRRMLRPLRALAEECSVAILAVRHLRKAAASSPTDAGGGSVGIGAAARVVMLAAADPEAAEWRVLARVKGNLAAPWSSLRYRLVARAGTVAIEWGGEVAHTAEALLAAAHAPDEPEERTRVDEAVGVLGEILGGGPVLVAEARRRLHAAGVADRTADRARARLGVRARPDGYQGAWRWHPPLSPSSCARRDWPDRADDGEKTRANLQSRQGAQSRHAPSTVSAGETGETAPGGGGHGREPGEDDGDDGMPPDPCPLCRTVAWWRQASGLIVCGTCHTPPLAATQGGARHGR